MAEVDLSGKGKLWVTDPTQELPLKIAPEGEASWEPETVLQVFRRTVERHANKPALRVKREGQYRAWTWREYADDVYRAARALIKLGLKPHETINIIGFNAPEWHISDLAAIAAGGVAAGIYTTNQSEACFYITDHSRARVVICENRAHLNKFVGIKDRLPNVVAYVQWEGEVPEGEGFYSWESFMALGEEAELQDEVEARIRDSKPGQCATLIYTSGTTGPPKAVMISHDNITWTTKLVAKYVGFKDGVESHVGYLPLSHIAAQLTDIHLPSTIGSCLTFAQPDALKGSLPQTLKEVRPTVFLGVPRVWEKIFEKMQEVGSKTTGLKKSLAGWAKGVGLEGSRAIQRGQGTPWGWTIANWVVFNKIKEALGLDKAWFCATAAAPISIEVLDYFNSLNIPIFEIYGMSECTGPQTINKPGIHRTGTCGPSIPGTELRLDRPDAEGNGEICYRGRHIFMGYMYNDVATAETIDSEGWLHSGDVGKLDGPFLSITGRIKELIITAGGENIPPVLIEDEIKREIGNVISNIMVVGDRRKFLSAVVTIKAEPNPEAAEGEYPFTNRLAQVVREVTGSRAETVEEALNDEAILNYINEGIKRANKKATSNAQVIQTFKILPKDFSIDGGELTPTLKLKRRVVAQQYAEFIERMYEEAEARVANRQ